MLCCPHPESVLLLQETGLASNERIPGMSRDQAAFRTRGFYARRYRDVPIRHWRRSRGENVMMAMTSTKRTSRKKTKRATTHTVNVGSRNKLLSNLTDECLNSYFESLNGHKPGD